MKKNWVKCLNDTKTALSLDRAVFYRVPHPPHQSKTDIKFWSFWRILVEGVGCLYHLPWGWYRTDHPLPESREFHVSKSKWRKTKDRFSLGYQKCEFNKTSSGSWLLLNGMYRGLTEVLRMECPITPGSTRVARMPDCQSVCKLNQSRIVENIRQTSCNCLVLLCFIDPSVSKIRNEASNCLWSFSPTQWCCLSGGDLAV